MDICLCIRNLFNKDHLNKINIEINFIFLLTLTRANVKVTANEILNEFLVPIVKIKIIITEHSVENCDPVSKK